MSKLNRRRFIKSTAAAAGVLSMPSFTIGKPDKPDKTDKPDKPGKPGESANSKINVAVVGAGGQGGYAVKMAAKETFAAICDVDDKRAEKAFKSNPKVPRFKDFRVMLDKMGKDIDAVAISTPDHTHFAAAMAAMERGKHVFVQKPLVHNIWQCRAMQKAAKKYKVITQMGNQGHTFEGMRRIKEWTDAGVIGDVTEVITWTNRPNKPWFIPPTTFPPATADVPAGLDWDLWQGPVAAKPFSNDYAPVRWRGWWDYGCGPLGDIGCHTFDAPFWALDLGLPTKVEVERKEPPGPGFISMGSVVTYHFPARGSKPPVTLKWYEKGYEVPTPKCWEKGKKLHGEGGMYMEGSKETLYHSGMRPTSPQILPNARYMEMKGELKKIDKLPSAGGGPIEEWFRAIKGGPMTGSNFDYAGPLTEMVLLGAMAQRSGKTIEWDAANMKVKGQPEFDAWIREPAREGWDFGTKL